jgi:SAM-dependent methyltransferase
MKAQMRAMWMTGDFGAFSQYTSPSDDRLAERVPAHPNETILDIGCGAGPLALRLARAGAQVTGVDIATNLLAQARAQAKAQGLSVRFDEGDAEALPYPDSSFDMVVSQFGVMFAPRPPVVVSEMARVCRPEGRSVLFNWTASGWVGQLFRTVARHAPPPPNAPLPMAWGDESAVRNYLAPAFQDIVVERGNYALRFPFGPAAVADFFLQNMGPIQRSFASLADADKQQAFRADMEEFITRSNTAAESGWSAESEYLQVTARRR